MLKRWFKKAFWLLVLLLIAGSVFQYFFPTAGLGVLEVTGGIYHSDDLIREINELRKDTRIKGVLVRIDSPGGTVAASQEIFESLKKLSAEKPVVASMGSVAASGGYYVALAAKEIFANPGTITGSIGVRMEHINVSELLEWAKIHYESLKSGELKDIGSPQRTMTPEEKKMLEGMLGEIHTQFKKTVAAERKISIQEVEAVADGRILTGEQAKNHKLVDALGGLEMAVAQLQSLTGLQGEPNLIYKASQTPWWWHFLGQAKSLNKAWLPVFQ